MNDLIKYAKGLGAKDNVIQLIKKLYNKQDIGEFEHIIDYLIHKDFDDLSWAGYDLLVEKSKKWTRLLNQNVLVIDEEYGKDIEVVYDFEDGYKFVKLVSQNAYTREGNMMSHCVGSYYGRDVEIFSLRDSFNKPHCTIEKDKQIKGKGNGIITDKYIDYIVSFLEYTGMKVRDSEMKNLGYEVLYFPEYVKNIDKFNLFRNRYYNKNNNTEIKYKKSVKVFTDKEELFSYKGDKVKLFLGNLDCSNNQLTSLPDNLNVSGYLDCSYNQLTSLPDNLNVSGDLYCGYNQLTSLPNNLNVSGNLYCSNNQLTSLPDNLNVSGNLDCSNNQLTSLPDNLNVSGYLDCSYNQLTSLPDNLNVSGDLYCGYNQLTK